MKNEGDVFNLYRNTFMLIYGDLVVVSGKKPPELLEQLENCMAHFAVAKTSLDPEVSQDNIDAVYRHIVRASLDAAKLLWTILHENAIAFVKDEDVRRFCANASQGAVHNQYTKAESASLDARRSEIANVGIDPEKSIEKWYMAALEYRTLLSLIDMDKVSGLRKLKLTTKIRENIISYIISFVLGVVASTVVAWYWPTPPQ